MSIGYINTGSVAAIDQDNKDVAKYVTLNKFGQSPLPNRILSFLNNSNPFTVTEIQNLWIFVNVVYDNNEIVEIQKIKVFNKGKGTYGAGNLQFTLSDLKLISTESLTSGAIESNPLTQVITITQIGTLNVAQYISQANPSIEFQNVGVAPRLVKITEAGKEADYLFLPVGGLYGLNELQTSDSDFQLLNDTPEGQNNIQIPIVYTLSEIGATSWEDDIPTLLAAHIASQNITVGETEIYSFEVTEDAPPEPTFNFDLELDLATLETNIGIVDQASFSAYLEGFGATNIVITDFILADATLKCNLSFDGATSFEFTKWGITKINNLSSLANLEILALNMNNISILENIDTLINLTDLDLSNNQISFIENLESLSSLVQLDLGFNNISDIGNNLYSLTNLLYLVLENNSITEFTESNFPLNIIDLNLQNNQISTIESITDLHSIIAFDLQNNQITTTQWDNLIDWANNVVSDGQLEGSGNTDDVSETLNSILRGKGWSVSF